MTDRQFIGPYEIKEELGRGGMGVVYRAHDASLGRDVAIKVLSEALTHDEAVVERFVREARSMAALNDGHIIQVYSIGDDAGSPYFVMEFVEGESLSARLKREGKLPVDEARRMIAETCEGLRLAHHKGVIHRDIKPGNLMLTTHGKVKVADFGIAMVQDFSKRLTNTGEFVGTPGYLSPEVCMGEEVDQRSDIFALGIVFFEMLTGDIPFSESSPLGMMLEVVNADIPDVRTLNADVDDATFAILGRMIAKAREDRYQTCEEILTDLAAGKTETSFSLQQPPAAESPANAPAATRVSQPSVKAPPPPPARPAATRVSAESGRIPEPPPGATRISDPSRAAPFPPPASPERSSSLVREGELMPRERPRRGGLLAGLMIGALAIVGAGGLFLAFKDRLLGGDIPQNRVNVAATDAAAAAAETGALAEPAGGSAAAPAPAAPLSAHPEPAVITGADEAPATGGSFGDEAIVLEGSPASVGETTVSDAAATPVDGAAAVVNEASGERDANSHGGSVAAMPARSAATEGAPETRLASARAPEPAPTPAAPEPAAPPRDPGVVVIAVGDPAIAAPVAQRIEASLADADGLVLLDAAFFSGINSVMGRDGVDLPGLAQVLQANGADVLVLAEVEYLGETPLQYYGRYDTLYSVNVKVRSVLVGERRPVGSGWQHKVEFTTLNALDKAREAVDPYVAELRDDLSDLQG